MNNKTGLAAVIDTIGSINVISLTLRSTSRITRALSLEILAGLCFMPGGHIIVIESLEYISACERNRSRFEIIVHMLWESSKEIVTGDRDVQVYNYLN